MIRMLIYQSLLACLAALSVTSGTALADSSNERLNRGIAIEQNSERAVPGRSVTDMIEAMDAARTGALRQHMFAENARESLENARGRAQEAATTARWEMEKARLRFETDFRSFRENQVRFKVMRTKPIERSLAMGDMTGVAVEHRFGDITIRRASDDRVTVKAKATVRGNDSDRVDRYLEAIDLRMVREGDTITVRSIYPEDTDDMGTRVGDYSMLLIVRVPERKTVTVSSSFGDVRLEEYEGTAGIENSYGDIVVADHAGPLTVISKFGGVTLRHITGDVRLTGEHASLDMTSINGALTAETSFADISAKTLMEDAVFQNNHGNVSVSQAVGDVEIITSYAPVVCTDVRGTATIRNSHGTVSARDIKGDAVITTSAGFVLAENIGGKAIVENDHAPVRLKDISGDTAVNTSFASVDVNGAGGNLIATNRHGSIIASRILEGNGTTPRRIELDTSHGTIMIGLPENPSTTIAAHTSNGEVRTDDIGLSYATQFTRELAEGTLGDGTNHIELKGDHATILIGKYMTQRDGFTVPRILPAIGDRN